MLHDAFSLTLRECDGVQSFLKS